MNLFLAVLPPIKTSVNPGMLVFLGVVILGMFALRLYNINKENATKKKPQKPLKTSQGNEYVPQKTPQSVDKKELKKFISEFELTNDQSLFFTQMCKKLNLTHPFLIIESRKLMDDVFSRSLAQLTAIVPSTRETELNKTLLFTIREKIENKKKATKNISSTQSLQKDYPFTFITKENEHYPMKVSLNTTDGLLCSTPRDSFGNELRVPIWSKVQILFSSRNGQTYQFKTRVLKYESGKSDTKILLAHSNTIKALPNRSHERKLFETACYFSQVTVANVVNGKHTEHKFYPSQKSSGGTIIDISVGGCSIKCNSPLGQGEYLQILCNLEGKIEDKIIGKIKRILKPEDNTSPVMHIQFAKMSRATMNRIFTYIYNEGASNK